MPNTFSGGLAGVASFTEAFASGRFAGSSIAYPPTRLQCQFRPGTALDLVDGVSIVKLTLAASTPETLDLSTLTDPEGNALTIARSRSISMKMISDVDGATVKVGNNGSDDFLGLSSSGSTINLYPSSPLNDGFVVFAAPNTTAMAIDSTHKNLKFDPGSTAAVVVVVVFTSSV